MSRYRFVVLKISDRRLLNGCGRRQPSATRIDDASQHAEHQQRIVPSGDAVRPVWMSSPPGAIVPPPAWRTSAAVSNVKNVRSGGVNCGWFQAVSICVGTEAGVAPRPGSEAHGCGLEADQFAYTYALSSLKPATNGHP